MAKVMIIGSVAQVEILPDPDDKKLVLAKCASDSRSTLGCSWSDLHDTTDDAIAAGEQHADGVR